MFEVCVSYRSRLLSRDTVNRRMEGADPGFWGMDHPLRYSNRGSAEHAADLVAYTFGPKYDVTVCEVDD